MVAIFGRLHILIALTIISALLMLIPAGYGFVIDHEDIGRNFLFSSLLFLILSGMIALATAANQTDNNARNTLLTSVAAFAGLPLVLAVPFAESLPDTGLFNAWWEMVSSLTTTGASLYSADLLPDPLHLWRALVGWMGGLFILVAAVAILAPLRVGGFEIMSSAYGRDEDPRQTAPGADLPELLAYTPSPSALHAELVDPMHRITRAARDVFPLYAGLTLLLWMILLLFGDDSLVAICRALGTLSTSGISPALGAEGADSGFLGEVAVFLLLIPALSRRFWPGGNELRVTERLRDDPEIRLAARVVILVALVLFVRHFFSALEEQSVRDDPDTSYFLTGLRAFWGGLFNAISYLTTTGWNSVDWQGARAWSGLTSPGLFLAGLAVFGGGVATTAGGVKLLRIYSLTRHVEREMERIIHPSSIAGGGRMARRLRREGAYVAFIFFMLFAISIAVTVVLISFQQLELDTATILSVAALTNTGPLASVIPLTPAFDGTAGVASAPWEGWSGLSVMTKTVLAGAMVVGRLETLAILALFTPEFWRR